MTAPTAERRRRQRAQTKEKKTCHGTPFSLASGLQTLRMPVRTKPRETRRLFRALPSFAAFGDKATEQLKTWRNDKPEDKARWKKLAQSFSEFIATPGYYLTWRDMFRAANPHLVTLTRYAEDGYYVRSVVYQWQIWVPNKSDEDIFKENGWATGAAAEEQALMTALQPLFAEEAVKTRDADKLKRDMETRRQEMEDLELADDEEYQPDTYDPHDGLPIRETLLEQADAWADQCEVEGLYTLEEREEIRQAREDDAAFADEERKEAEKEERRMNKRIPYPFDYDSNEE